MAAMRELRELGCQEACGRAYGEATKEAAEREFAKSYGVKRARHACIHRLCGRVCGFSRQRVCHCSPPGSDHGTMWLKNGKPFMFVCQPYTMGTIAMAEAVTFAKANGLEIEIRTNDAFYFPGMAFMVIWRRVGWRKENEGVIGDT